jgi:hypothetical protein
MIISDVVACRSQNEEHWSYRVFPMIMTSDNGMLDRTFMMVWRIFSNEGCSLDLIHDLEA